MECDDGTIADTDAMGQWGPLFIAGGDKIGRSFRVAYDGTLRRAMEEAGFTDIQEKQIKVCSYSNSTFPHFPPKLPHPFCVGRYLDSRYLSRYPALGRKCEIFK